MKWKCLPLIYQKSAMVFRKKNRKLVWQWDEQDRQCMSIGLEAWTLSKTRENWPHLQKQCYLVISKDHDILLYNKVKTTAPEMILQCVRYPTLHQWSCKTNSQTKQYIKISTINKKLWNLFILVTSTIWDTSTLWKAWNRFWDAINYLIQLFH